VVGNFGEIEKMEVWVSIVDSFFVVVVEVVEGELVEQRNVY